MVGIPGKYYLILVSQPRAREDYSSGHLGAGKSVLTANIVEDIQKRENLNLLYFFFRDGDLKTTSPLEMVVSLIAQLITSGTDYPRLMGILKMHIEAGRCFNGGGRSDFKVIWTILLEMLLGYPQQIVIVLDALDECADPAILSKNIQLQGIAESGVKLLLTGRPVVDRWFSQLPNVTSIPMGVDEDIRKFVKEKVENHETLKNHGDKIIATIHRNSAGMFRYAGVCKSLKNPGLSS